MITDGSAGLLPLLHSMCVVGKDRLFPRDADTFVALALKVLD